MTYLEQLKQAVSDAFKDASDKDTVDKIVSINSLIASIDSENKQLCDKNRELIAAYKDAVLHPGVTKENEPEPTDIPAEPTLDFSDFLAKAMKENN